MNTLFEDIYKMFLTKIKSFGYFEMTDVELEESLVPWLELAVADFYQYCAQVIDDVDFTIPSGSFNVKLTLLENQILSEYMLVHYISHHVNDLEGMEQVLNSRDYRIYSEANYLEAKAKLKDRVQRDIDIRLSRYSYDSMIQKRKK